MSSEGYWVNNEHIIFEHAIKPCKFCGFCPYGQLVEEFPVPSISRSEAIKIHEEMKQDITNNVFNGQPNPRNPYNLTLEDAKEEVEDFDPDIYLEDPIPIDYKVCEIFGHHCPVYYHAELFSEDNSVTQEEIDAFENEIDNYLAEEKERVDENDEPVEGDE